VETEPEPEESPVKYQIKNGDTLIRICRNYYGDADMVKKVCEWNGLDDQDKIYVGQTIELP
jgi:nucleoid-associated protein YgaU